MNSEDEAGADRPNTDPRLAQVDSYQNIFNRAMKLPYRYTAYSAAYVNNYVQ